MQFCLTELNPKPAVATKRYGEQLSALKREANILDPQSDVGSADEKHVHKKPNDHQNGDDNFVRISTASKVPESFGPVRLSHQLHNAVSAVRTSPSIADIHIPSAIPDRCRAARQRAPHHTLR